MRLGALGGCGRTHAPADSAAAKSNPASMQSMASDLADADRLAPHVRLVQTAPRPLPVNDATSIGGISRSAVVWAAYPPAQGADGDDAPRVRLAQARPMPLPAEGPEFDAPQRSVGQATTDQAAIAPLPPLAAAPMNAGPLPRNPALDAVARQADAQTAHGFELAQRGAIHSARAEFVAALHTIAAALDSANCGNNRDRMLAAGLESLDEVDDFTAPRRVYRRRCRRSPNRRGPSDARVERGLARRIESHGRHVALPDVCPRATIRLHRGHSRRFGRSVRVGQDLLCARINARAGRSHAWGQSRRAVSSGTACR